LHWQIAGLCALEDAIDVADRPLEQRADISSVDDGGAVSGPLSFFTLSPSLDRAA